MKRTREQLLGFLSLYGTSKKQDGDLTTTKNIKFIEKEINKEMEKQIKQMLEFFKKKQVDPVGIRKKPLSKKEWRELYKEAKFEVHVNNTIVKTGVID